MMVRNRKGRKAFFQNVYTRPAAIEITSPEKFACSPEGRGEPAGRKPIIGKHESSARPGNAKNLFNDRAGRYGTEQVIAKDRLKAVPGEGKLKSMAQNKGNISHVAPVNTPSGLAKHFLTQIKSCHCAMRADLTGQERKIKPCSTSKVQHPPAGRNLKPLDGYPSIMSIHTE